MKKAYFPIKLSIERFSLQNVLVASEEGDIENGANFSNDIEFTE